MAGTLSRISASMATVQNENTIALVNNNIDFTLFKAEVPVEFTGLGETISHRRRLDAEEGPLHRTARKLGALFEGYLPVTEELFKAYGTRVSEISSMPAINPRDGFANGSMFASHIGAETTSIWAAATSGSAAIAVHLLGCMLARMFQGPEAISIWVELVKKQKETIRNKQGSGLYCHEQLPSRSAAQQDMTRAELSSWDASARAWLQSADQAKLLQHKQTMLILENASVPVNSEHDTYTSVMKAWAAALEAMNNLVKGVSQRVQDGAALLAISSWHLYPDMGVFGTSCVKVVQNDPLFTRTALLTLGLQHVREHTKSVYWSLPLAYLRYYGHPVKTSKTVGRENSRVTYKEFAYIILGCLFNGWKDFASTNEQGISWVLKLSSILPLSHGLEGTNGADKPSWLAYLRVAAVELSDCDDSARKEANQLMALGRKRSEFLQNPAIIPPPLFGLSQIDVLLPLLKSEHERVVFLRHVGAHYKLDTPAFLIRYECNADSGTPDVEYATVSPVSQALGLSLKRTHNGEQREEVDPSSIRHVRWIPLSDQQLVLCLRRSDDIRNVFQTRSKLLALEKLQAIEMTAMRRQPFGSFNDPENQATSQQSMLRNNEINTLKELIRIGERRLCIEERGELCLPIRVSNYNYGDLNSDFVPALIRSLEQEFFKAARNILEISENDGGIRSSISLTFFVGDADLSSICSVVETRTLGSVHTSVAMTRHIMTPALLETALPECTFDSNKIASHFFDSEHSMIRREISTLSACAMMADIYKHLPGASISTLVVKQSLSRAKWIPSSKKAKTLSFPQAFACIAMFESGECNLDPAALSEVFAMSSGNSLYIAGCLLCDPYEHNSSGQIRRVVGNIGRAGITLLISPPDVKMREANPEKWMTINHNPFDGKLENHFTQTSMHLSFTDYEISLVTEDNPKHIIDRAVIMVETLISIYDGGTWVAEVDILKAFRSHACRPVCNDPKRHRKHLITGAQNASTKDVETDGYLEVKAKHPQLMATSVENWDELIEAPSSGVIVVRAHKNWLARLAATAVCVRKEFTPIILPEDPCWDCCAVIIPRDSYSRFAIVC